MLPLASDRVKQHDDSRNIDRFPKARLFSDFVTALLNVLQRLKPAPSSEILLRRIAAGLF
jgi:hypothetical protein